MKTLREVSEAMTRGVWVALPYHIEVDAPGKKRQIVATGFDGDGAPEPDAIGIALFASEDVRKALVEWYARIMEPNPISRDTALFNALTAALKRVTGEKP